MNYRSVNMGCFFTSSINARRFYIAGLCFSGCDHRCLTHPILEVCSDIIIDFDSIIYLNKCATLQICALDFFPRWELISCIDYFRLSKSWCLKAPNVWFSLETGTLWYCFSARTRILFILRIVIRFMHRAYSKFVLVDTDTDNTMPPC
jgi:hypothetical protein